MIQQVTQGIRISVVSFFGFTFDHICVLHMYKCVIKTLTYIVRYFP